MNSRVLIAVLSIGIVGISYLNYQNKQAYAEKEQRLLEYRQKIVGKNYYLKTISDYALEVHKLSFTNIPINKDIIIYYADQACSICVEDFLKDYMDNSLLSDRVIVISDNKLKDDLVANFNDAFNANYAHQIDTTKYFSKDVLDVLFIKREFNEVKTLLTYSYQPEEKNYFLEFSPTEFKKKN